RRDIARIKTVLNEKK
ncbi:MAG: 50S ribosomal protein L29, partial [Gammaproteobacteria bacterium]